MKLRPFAALIAASVSIAAIDGARADWLDDAWSRRHSEVHGNPSITIGQSGQISVLLPNAVLQEAQARGASPQAAVEAFLGRYGPQMCSHLLDLSVPRKDLKVELRHLDPVAEIGGLFVASPDHQDFTLDYMPAGSVHCVAPAEKVS